MAIRIFFLFIIPVIAQAQTYTGFTITNESGDINVRQFDTTVTASGNYYRSELITFPDSTAAAVYLESKKNALFEQAGRWAQKAREDSIAARRLREIGTDAGIFALPAPAQPPEQIPEMIILPAPNKSPAAKQKKPRKKKGQ